jgi:hypothetical protein
MLIFAGRYLKMRDLSPDSILAGLISLDCLFSLRWDGAHHVLQVQANMFAAQNLS